MADKNAPDCRGLANEKQAAPVELCRDVFAGTRRMREKGTTYLPKFPREKDGPYATRLQTAVLYNAFAVTVHGLAGMVMRKDPALDNDVPQVIKDAWENIDLAGQHGAAFTKGLLADAIAEGHAHIFVDMPRATGAANLAEEKAAGARPYWIAIKKQDVLRFTTVNIGGQPVLQTLAYRECVVEKDGAYGEVEVERVREYTRGAGVVEWKIYTKRRVGEKDVWTEETGPAMTIDEIPLATVYGKRTGFLTSDPPLEDLAHENVRHYQVRSDRDTCMHIASVPIPFFSGIGTNQKLDVGPNDGISGPPGSDAKYLESTGAPLDASRTELQDSEKRMATLGLAQLAPDAATVETATAKVIRKNEQDSSLSSIARSLQDCLEAAAGFHAKWLKLGKDAGGSIEVNKDFGALVLDPQSITAFSAMVDKRQLSIETLWAFLSRGGALPDDFDPEVEQERIDAMGLPPMPRGGAVDPKTGRLIPTPVPIPDPGANA